MQYRSVWQLTVYTIRNASFDLLTILQLITLVGKNWNVDVAYVDKIVEKEPHKHIIEYWLQIIQ